MLRLRDRCSWGARVAGRPPSRVDGHKRGLPSEGAEFTSVAARYLVEKRGSRRYVPRDEIGRHFPVAQPLRRPAKLRAA